MSRAAVPRLLTQNSELRADGIHNWTLPAWVVRVGDGTAVNVCPQAGACVKFCYARNGTCNFPAVKAAHVRNLEAVRDDLNAWTTAMLNELGARRFRPRGQPRMPWLSREHLSGPVAALLDGGAACIRIHDSGDFFSEEYLLAWLAIASYTPDVLFYCYTKEVALMKRVLSSGGPDNFLVCYSLGGRQDHLIDRNLDYHAEVFPDVDSIKTAGYYSQDANDLLCVTAPTVRVGIPANNIRHYQKRMAGRTFGDIEAATRRANRPKPQPVELAAP